MLVQHRAKRSELFRDKTIKVSIYAIQQLSGVFKQKKKKKVLLSMILLLELYQKKKITSLQAKKFPLPAGTSAWDWQQGSSA